jgi:hypothetical protein
MKISFRQHQYFSKRVFKNDCFANNEIAFVSSITRNFPGIAHLKLTEVIDTELFDYRECKNILKTRMFAFIASLFILGINQIEGILKNNY